MHHYSYNRVYNCAAHRLDCLPFLPYPVGLPVFSAAAELAAELTAETAEVTEVTLPSAGAAAASTSAARAVVAAAIGDISAAIVEEDEELTATTGELAAVAVFAVAPTPPGLMAARLAVSWTPVATLKLLSHDQVTSRCPGSSASIGCK